MATSKTTTKRRPSKTAAQRKATRRRAVPKPSPVPAKPAAASPSPAARAARTASLARRKAGLIAELREGETTPSRQAEIRKELEGLGDVPNLSYHELQRLG